MRRALPALALLTMLASGCAIVVPVLDPAPVAGPLVPPSLEAEVEALARVETYDDPLLNEYLAGIMDRLAGEDERESGVAAPIITVLRDPTIAAFSLPGGRVYLHTGLLSRVANEAQLATVLARELTHVRRARGAAVSAGPAGLADAIAAIAPSLIGAQRPGADAIRPLSSTAAVILGKGLTIAYAAAMTGRGDELERDADVGALERLVRAAYDPKEAPRTFERLRREARAGGVVERFFLADAASSARVDRMTGLVTSTYTVAAALPDTMRETPEFEAVLAPVARENARLELRAGRLRSSQEQLDRALAAMPTDARAHLYLGDLHRLRAQRARSVADRDELARAALASYERCVALDPALGEVTRQIGLLYYQQGRYDFAREAFERYVARAPDAPDAARVAEYVLLLTR